jgi:hypothetical protein
MIVHGFYDFLRMARKYTANERTPDPSTAAITALLYQSALADSNKKPAKIYAALGGFGVR